MHVKQMDALEPYISEMKEAAEQSKALGLGKEIQIYSDIKKMRMGAKAEKNAAHMLERWVFGWKSKDDCIIANDLRLEIDGQIAQIDHLVMNKIGVVRLIETKTFSTGIKITDDGNFLRWNDKKKVYEEIPSPLEQSVRHEQVLTAVLKEIGYDAILFQHFVVVDYQAKLIKPDNKFHNVCRPDKLSEALNKEVDSNVIPTMKEWKAAFKGVPRLFTKGYKADEMKDVAEKLVSVNFSVLINCHKVAVIL